MDEGVLRVQSSLRPGSFKSSLSGKSTPRSPAFRRAHSSRTPRREFRSSSIQWFRSNRLVYWLLLITLWAYLGFYVQSRWAHGDNKEKKFLGFEERNQVLDTEQGKRRDLLANDNLVAVNKSTIKDQVELAGRKRVDIILTKKQHEDSSGKSASSRKKTRRSSRRLRGKKPVKQIATAEEESMRTEPEEPTIPSTNATYGLLVGPFGHVEDRVLEWSPEKRSGTCDRKGDFARLVWSRRFVLVFHELSMTGAPISMLELATELLSCGATVSAVVLSKKGGLLPELSRRKIKIIEDRADLSFKTAIKADLVIPGSAVCGSWIDQYINKFPAGGSQIAWWIMENRFEYFIRAKPVLNRVKMLIFLSDMQSKQWLSWCEEARVQLRSQPIIIPLSVNDELAFVAGIPCSLNTPSFSPEKMLEKRKLLRTAVRQEMGLSDGDMLVVSLSSINPGKGQLLLLESAAMLIEKESLQVRLKMGNPKDNQGGKTLASRHHLRGLLQKLQDAPVDSASYDGFTTLTDTVTSGAYENHGRNILSVNSDMKWETLKILIGSVGSKSNKVFYVEQMLKFLSDHKNLSKSVLWSPATTRVASLYSAADVYVMNSQGVGETFGRVTIEAMAFGLPVLGTDAGGTKEILERNVTGLIHPVGRPGSVDLAKNIQFLLKNPSERERMGIEGRKKVKKMYLKRHMYQRFVEVITKCMRSK